MAKVAFLGLGAMGGRMAARLAAAGHEMTVWNRTPAAAAPLLAAGARAVGSPRAAAEGAEVVLSMLRDDAASTAVWDDPGEGAAAGLAPGAVAAEASTLTPGRVGRLAARVSAAGAGFLAVPVLGSLPQAEAGTLVHLAGGDAALVERMRPILAVTGSSLRHVGGPEDAALAKLLVNGLFAVQAAALAETLGRARRGGIGAAALRDLLEGLPVLSPAAAGLLGLMVAGRDAPLFPVELVAKDLGYLLDGGGSQPVATAAAAVFANASRAGHGAANISAVHRLY